MPFRMFDEEEWSEKKNGSSKIFIREREREIERDRERGTEREIDRLRGRRKVQRAWDVPVDDIPLVSPSFVLPPLPFISHTNTRHQLRHQTYC
jgi:hypothetical protein